MKKFKMRQCEVDEDTGHLMCPEYEDFDFKDLESSPRSEDGDGTTRKKRNVSVSDRIEVV